MVEFIYADTDSNYISFEDIVPSEWNEKKKLEFVKYISDGFCQLVINKTMKKLDDDMNTSVKGLIKADREAVAKSAFWVSKKKYAMLLSNSEGVEYYPYKSKSVGLDAGKSSFPQKAKDTMTEYYKNVLYDGGEAADKYLNSFREKFNSLEPDEISYTIGVGEINKYLTGKNQYGKGTTAQSKAAITHNRFIDENNLTSEIKEINEGDKIKIILLKEPNILREQAFGWMGDWNEHFEPIKKYIDYDKQFEKVIGKHIALVNKSIEFERKTMNELDLM